MIKSSLLFTTGVLLISSLSQCISDQTKQAKQEILQAEYEFNQMAQTKGLKEAFLEFADDSAALIRNGNIIKGKVAIKTYFDNQTVTNILLSWKPNFVEVSASGDLGYTYGPYQFSGISPTGDTLSSEGIFHTVWKKQTDGSWKYVYD